MSHAHVKAEAEKQRSKERRIKDPTRDVALMNGRALSSIFSPFSEAHASPSKCGYKCGDYIGNKCARVLRYSTIVRTSERAEAIRPILDCYGSGSGRWDGDR